MVIPGGIIKGIKGGVRECNSGEKHGWISGGASIEIFRGTQRAMPGDIPKIIPGGIP